MTTTQTFIAPDGKLYTHKKYVNWEGVRQVEGTVKCSVGWGDSIPETATHFETKYEHIFIDFTIQD